jgi:hypothetical protein
MNWVDELMRKTLEEAIVKHANRLMKVSNNPERITLNCERGKITIERTHD